MGLFNDIVDRFTHPDFKDPSWQFGHPSVALDTWLDNKRAELAAGQTAYAPAWVHDLLSRTSGDYQARWKEINRTTEARLRHAGLNPAAAAAAAARVASEATRDELSAGSDRWRDLMSAWQDRVGDSRKITTHEPHTAYTQGFLGVGGGQGVADLFGRR